MAKERITRDDVVSAVGARHELGDDLEPAVVDAFLDKIERAIDAQVDAKVAESRRRSRGGSGLDQGQRLALSIVSLGTGIPITAIAAEEAGAVGILIVWCGIVGVNVAQRFSRD
jgi:hypothetical protein